MEASVESLTEVMVHNICCSDKETNKEKFPIYLLHFYKGTQTVSRGSLPRLLLHTSSSVEKTVKEAKIKENYQLIYTTCNNLFKRLIFSTSKCI